MKILKDSFGTVLEKADTLKITAMEWRIHRRWLQQ